MINNFKKRWLIFLLVSGLLMYFSIEIWPLLYLSIIILIIGIVDGILSIKRYKWIFFIAIPIIIYIIISIWIIRASNIFYECNAKVPSICCENRNNCNADSDMEYCKIRSKECLESYNWLK